MNKTQTDSDIVPSRILIVDDNAMNRDLLVRRLERHGYVPTPADGGIEALKLIQCTTFDLILLDINMPDLDGISVLQTIRETNSTTDLPVIMVSAHDQSDGIAEALNKGANDYITKPIDFPVAFARINTHLQMGQALAKLKESEERYALAFRGANDGLWDWNLGTGKIHYSDRWKAMLGLDKTTMNHDPESWFTLVHPDEIEDLKHAIEDHLLGKTEALNHEYRALHRDGKFRWLLTRGVASRGKDGQAIRISGSQTNITHTKAYDPITKIPNELLFLDRLELLLDRGRRSAQGIFSISLIKIDRLNELRQTFGPVAGENILVEIAKRLTKTLRDQDSATAVQSPDPITISRHTEADFAVLLEGCKDETGAPKVSERIQALISEPIIINGEQIVLSASIGTTTVQTTFNKDASPNGDKITANEIIAHAASALARARSNGIGHIELYDTNMQDRALGQLKMEHNLRQAVQAGDLSLHFQPIIVMADGSISGCEALARWSHPDHGVVSPEVFIPLAEKCGLIDAIGEWVLKEACNQHRKWGEAGLDPIDMSVNLSVIQLQRKGIETIILDIVKRTNMDPYRLKLELTESMFMQDINHISQVLSTLHDQGIGIAIDDFGTGFSSLSYLNRLPITHLKIDRSFISAVSKDIAAQAIVQSTLLMAQSLGIAVVAEGIDATDQVDLLKLLKAEYGQGFLYWKPLNPDDFTALLKERTGATP